MYGKEYVFISTYSIEVFDNLKSIQEIFTSTQDKISCAELEVQALVGRTVGTKAILPHNEIIFPHSGLTYDLKISYTKHNETLYFPYKWCKLMTCLHLMAGKLELVTLLCKAQ